MVEMKVKMALGQMIFHPCYKNLAIIFLLPILSNAHLLKPTVIKTLFDILIGH